MSDTDKFELLSWEVIAKMTSEEYEQRRDEIRVWVISHRPSDESWRNAPNTPGRLTVYLEWLLGKPNTPTLG